MNNGQDPNNFSVMNAIRSPGERLERMSAKVAPKVNFHFSHRLNKKKVPFKKFSEDCHIQNSLRIK